MQTISPRSLRPLLSLCAGALLSLAAGCGLVSKDVPVTADFQVGGFPPTSITSLGATQISTPLSASAGDISKLSSITMTQATLSSTDGKDLSFITGGTIVLSGNPPLTTVELARLSPPGAVGTTNYTIENETDLKPYLEGGGSIGVTITYAAPPVPARGLELKLNIHATL